MNFLCFRKKDYDKWKKVTKFLTGLCQDDVTTSNGDVISRNKLQSHVREKILRKVTKEILEICYCPGVMQQKVGLGVNLPPPLGSMRVKKKFKKIWTSRTEDMDGYVRNRAHNGNTRDKSG